MLTGRLAHLPLASLCSSPTGTCKPDRKNFVLEALPARFAGLPWVAAIIVAPTASSTAKPVASAPGAFRFRFGLVDGQRSPTQICAVERGDGLVGFTGIGHFHKTKATRPTCIPVGHQCDPFDASVCLEEVSQLGFGCAVGQIPNVKVLHRNSSFSKSSRLVGVTVVL